MLLKASSSYFLFLNPASYSWYLIIVVLVSWKKIFSGGLLWHLSFGLFCSLFIGSFEVNVLISFSCLGIINSLARALLSYTMHYRMFKGNRMGDEKKTRQKLPTCLDFLKPSIKTPDRLETPACLVFPWTLTISWSNDRIMIFAGGIAFHRGKKKPDSFSKWYLIIKFNGVWIALRSHCSRKEPNTASYVRRCSSLDVKSEPTLALSSKVHVLN